MTARGRLRKPIAGLVGVFVLAACSSVTPGGGNSGGAAADPVPQLLSAVDLRLPVQHYLPSLEQAERFAAARSVLVSQCMRKFGFDYHVAPVDTVNFGPRSLTDRRYGITDAAAASENGYGLGERDPSRRPEPARPQTGPDEQTALIGRGKSMVHGLPVPNGGCVAEADRGLDQEVPNGANPQLGQRLQFESFEATKQDPLVGSAFMAWSSCMAESGYHYADPLAAVADPEFVGPPTPRHLAVANTDIRCKARTNLVGVWYTAESEYQRQQIERNAAAFSAAQDAIAARYRVAEGVLRNFRRVPGLGLAPTAVL